MNMNEAGRCIDVLSFVFVLCSARSLNFKNILVVSKIRIVRAN